MDLRNNDGDKEKQRSIFHNNCSDLNSLNQSLRDSFGHKMHYDSVDFKR